MLLVHILFSVSYIKTHIEGSTSKIYSNPKEDNIEQKTTE